MNKEIALCGAALRTALTAWFPHTFKSFDSDDLRLAFEDFVQRI